MNQSVLDRLAACATLDDWLDHLGVAATERPSAPRRVACLKALRRVLDRPGWAGRPDDDLVAACRAAIAAARDSSTGPPPTRAESSSGPPRRGFVALDSVLRRGPKAD